MATFRSSAFALGALLAGCGDPTVPPEPQFAASISFESAPDTGRAGVLLAPVRVRVLDSAGQNMTRGLATIEVSATSIGLSGVKSRPIVDGIAVFDSLRINRPGLAVRLLARSGSASVTSSPFPVAARLRLLDTVVTSELGEAVPTFRVAVVNDSGQVITVAITVTATVGSGTHQQIGNSIGSWNTSNGLASISGLIASRAGAGNWIHVAGLGLDADSMPLTVTWTPVEISAGRFITCGYSSQGVAACWGANHNGYLGAISPNMLEASPVLVPTPPLSALSAGSYHACGLIASGEAWCWGQSGALGTHVFGWSPPSPVITPVRFRSVRAGENVTCGIALDSLAYCWGFNSFGVMGVGDTMDRALPTLVTGGHRFAQLATWYSHSCGIDGDRQAWCWGWNSDGQLGTGDTVSTLIPVAAAAGHELVAISVSWYHTCALDTLGRAWCWGDKNSLGSVSFSPYESTPQAVDGGHVFASLATTAGSWATCARTLDGTGWCWGLFDAGQLGYGTWSGNVRPPVVIGGGHSWSRLSVGSRHACGLTNSGLYCWGDDYYGQLGNGLPLAGVNLPTVVLP